MNYGYGVVVFNGLTIINTNTRLVEIKRATQHNLSGLEAVDDSDNMWLDMYPNLSPIYLIKE